MTNTICFFIDESNVKGYLTFNPICETLKELLCPRFYDEAKLITLGSRLAKVRFATIQFYDLCPVGPSTPDFWCITVATQASVLYLVRF